MNLPRNQCPSALNATTAATLGLTPGVTFYDEMTADGTYATGDDVWMRRITEVGDVILVDKSLSNHSTTFQALFRGNQVKTVVTDIIQFLAAAFSWPDNCD